MADLISREAAIAEFNRCELTPDGGIDANEAIEILARLPSAQPEQKTGKWISNSPLTEKCDQCGFVIADWKVEDYHYCPNCGAKMEDNT